MEKGKKQPMGVTTGAADKGGPIKSDSDLHPDAKKPPIEADDLPSHRALREAMRSKKDDYIVKSDLEDDDQRYPLPGMKDQD
ncbi:hypothetical protein PYH37_001612 [Sinorhizobium numidicum]|uniref:Uncharacterized protein n=1 Tax=Sinorhizobium numidicum TaxID=680248 RepID=A0ABY8CNH4_9HYPH|nr:hypothetical protein [Sinorhizobium numidicum]WEX74221.1 hypothetical protein PYH37_001612 [Sinorhizobium numidicum]WEX80206.1 hypothetical protein PYH38_001613 [Sinorhizobium numidicum]